MKNNEDQLVVIGTFSTYEQAAIVAAMLESHDVECYLQDVNSSNIVPLFQVKLVAPLREVARIEEILASEPADAEL